MKKPGLNARRLFRVGLAAGVVLLVSTAGYLAPAQATNPRIKQYTTAISPASVGAGSTVSYTLKLTNVPASPQSISAANLSSAMTSSTSAHFSFLQPSPASGFPQALSRPLLDGTTPVGSATLTSATQLQMRNLWLRPGHFVTVTFNAEAPCVGNGLVYSWNASVKQSNDFHGPPGNDYHLAGSPAATTVAGGCHLGFTAEPATTLAGGSITTGLFSTGGPITVGVFSQTAPSTPASTPVTFSTALVSMTASDVASGGALTLRGTTTRTAVSGVATFTDLAIVDGNHQVILHAAPANAAADGIDSTGADSESFDITDAAADCANPKPGTPTCSGGVPDGNASTKAVVTTTATSGFLAVSLDVQFERLTVCPGSRYVLPPTDGVTYDVYGGSGAMTLSYTVLKPDRPWWKFELCYASTAAFTTPTGPAGTMTDESGDTYYIGLLRDCGRWTPAPCFAGPTTDHRTCAVTLRAYLPAEGDRWTH
ncbi:MAG TPA: hypothetical protein VID47_10780 [Actinomycetota bacterium]